MLSDHEKDKWVNFKAAAKKAWADLTDDDFDKAEGSIDKFLGIAQEKFGGTKEDAQAKIAHHSRQ